MTNIYVCTMCHRPCVSIVEESATSPTHCLYDGADRVNWHLMDIDRYAYDKPIHPYEKAIKHE